MKDGGWENEREAWDALRGPHNRKMRQQLWREFRGFIPPDISPKKLVRWFGSPTGRQQLQEYPDNHSLKTIHPEAINFLGRHGQVYTGKTWMKPRPDGGELPAGKCFACSWSLTEIHHEREGQKRTRKAPLVYVEGITMGPLVGLMHHGWNAHGISGTMAFDWTFYSGSQWGYYVGFPVTYQEYRHAAKLAYPKQPGSVISLFGRPNFPSVQDYLRWLVRKRRQS